MAAGIPFALFPASPTLYELRDLVKLSKVKTIFTSPRNVKNARIVGKEAGLSESNGIFILEGKVEGERSFDDLVCSVKEPAKDCVKPVDKDTLAYLLFSSGTTGPPKGEATFAKPSTCYLARVHGVNVSRRHGVTQEYHVLGNAGFRRGCTKQCGCTSQSPPEPDLPAFTSANVMNFRSSPRNSLLSQSHWLSYHFTTVTG